MDEGSADLSRKLKSCQGFNWTARQHSHKWAYEQSRVDDLCAGSDFSAAFLDLALVRGLRELPSTTSPHVRAAENFDGPRVRVIASFSTRGTFSVDRE